MKKKGQIAIETLLVYGLVILVVLLAIGALVRFGVLDMDKYLPDKCNIGSSALSCEEWKVTQAGAVDLVFKNTFGKAVEISSVSISSEDGSMGTCSIAPALTVGINADTPIIALTGCGVTSASGQKVKGELQITYKQSGGAINQEATGSLTSTVS